MNTLLRVTAAVLFLLALLGFAQWLIDVSVADGLAFLAAGLLTKTLATFVSDRIPPG